MTLRLLLAYDGTRYAGWQRQPDALTVQTVLEDALRRLDGHPVTTVAAGRTDAGVHAWGQVVQARLRTPRPPAVIHRALNALLPPDIVVRRVVPAPPRAHAQFDAVHKWYRYRLVTGPIRPVFDRPYVHHLAQSLDLDAMRRAGRVWVGRHDFRAFHSTGRLVTSTRRRIYRLRITREKGCACTSAPFLCIDVVADGFLYHMVRRMVGALLLIGTGRWPPDAARRLLARRTTLVAPTAPARGLCLMQVSYA
ncbi:MAG: tRNA pseudouridine(38-40) synthase TruA [Candidatus Omnitrophica bacterium]|nr:tRNA pseudouridine(38-40) synthase TruA [Candidatus Omnitrophota bacterium]